MDENTAIRLRKALKQKNISQAKLSQMTGISSSMITNYLKGNYLPKQNNIFLMAKALKINPTWLMGYDVVMEDEKKEEPVFSDSSLYIKKIDLNKYEIIYTINNGLLFAKKVGNIMKSIVSFTEEDLIFIEEMIKRIEEK